MLVKNDLFDYGLSIYQDSNLFKFSLDSILLSEFVNANKTGNNILDMCAGNMAIPLILSRYTNKKIIGFEIQKPIYELGVTSINLNNLNDKLTIINDDIKNIGNYFKPDYFDTLICNPPFFKINSDLSLINTNPILSIARHEIKLTIEDIFLIAYKYLKPKGCLYLVHRADRLDEIINLGFKYSLNVKKINLITTKVNEKPYIVLIKAVKNSKSGVIIEPELCIQNLKTYQNIFKKGDNLNKKD